MAEQTFFDKVWSLHQVAELDEGTWLLHIDRHLMHDLGGAGGIREANAAGYGVRNPELTYATVDHAISTSPGRSDESFAAGIALLHGLREETRRADVRLFDIGDEDQGIVHVIGPSLGLTLPGITLVCGDSHTCTHGGLGALSFGIGSSELAHVLATQTLVQKKPKRMRVRFEGTLPPAVTPKDVIIYLIGTIGANGGDGYAIEYAGDAIRAMPIEGRLTICNMSIELGAKIGMIAPDDRTYEYLSGRKFAPRGKHWDAALAHWRTLPSDDGAIFDKEVVVDVGDIAPQVTWGISPEQTIAIDQPIPDPSEEPDPTRRKSMVDALEYMGLESGLPLAGLEVDWVFIGSCTNGRISDLREAAKIVRTRQIADSVTAWVVPGSLDVKKQAEAEGLDRVFTDAGFQWREPGCSMCSAVNGEVVSPGQRSVSTTNRNFIGRQGPGARTHLASPAMAAAAAIEGRIADARKF